MISIVNKDTPIFEKDIKDVISFKCSKESNEHFKKLAKLISKETGTPESLIYNPPSIIYLKNWFKIDGYWYYFKKQRDNQNMVNELLGELISNYFGLDTIHYQIAKLNINGSTEFGLISKNFSNPLYSYKQTSDYKLEAFNDLSILKEVKRICKSEREYLLLLEDLKKFFIRDFYVGQGDRTDNNILFKETENGIRLAPLYDYENSFESINLGWYSNSIGTLDLANKNTIYLLKHDEKFQELLYLIIKINIYAMLEMIEDTHKIIIPEDIQNVYIRSDASTKALVYKSKLI